jgi:hypothetical protein
MPACVVRMDRCLFLAHSQNRNAPPRFPGFRRLRDSFVRTQTTTRTYRRVSEHVNPRSGVRLFLQYQPDLPGLAPFKGTLVPLDRRGLSCADVEQVVNQFGKYRLLLLEIAFDFPRESGIDFNFVQRFGIFGKSRPNNSPLFTRSGLYGSKKAAKMVRVYPKKELDSFRVELEVHSPWLRRYGIVTLQDLAKLPQSLFPKHIRFVNMNWTALTKHLSRRGLNSAYIIREAKNRSSIHAVIEFLRNSIGVHNPHRFLRTVAPSQKIFQSLKNWARVF